MAKRKLKDDSTVLVGGKDYEGLLTGVAGLLDQARTAIIRVVNDVMTATYYELVRRIPHDVWRLIADTAA